MNLEADASRSLTTRVLGFVGLPLLSAISPLIALPAITRAAGAEGWAAIAIGQSIGTTLSVIVEFGWSVSGPAAVAAANHKDRCRLFWQSSLMRAFLFVLVTPVGVVAASYLAPSPHRFEASLTALAFTAVGFSPAWFFIGTGQPLKIAILDALPRVFVTLAAGLTVATTKLLIIYPLALAAFGIIAMLALPFMVGGRPRDPLAGFGVRELIRLLGSQFDGAAIRIVSMCYVALPVSLLAAVSPGAVPAFAAVDRLQKIALVGLQPVANAFQGWVVEDNGSMFQRRARIALKFNGSVAIAGGAAFAVFAPFAASFLFSGEVGVPISLSFLAAGTLSAVCATRSTGLHYLVPAGKSRGVLLSVIFGGLLGVPAVITLGSLYGAEGAGLAVLVSEVGVLMVQIYWIRASSRSKAKTEVIQGTPGAST